MRRAAAGPRVGKRVGGALYLHRTAVDLLDVARKEMVASASERTGACWNVAKIEGEAVSLLRYEEFDDSPFPCLLASVRVSGDRVVRTDYEARENPPILHRKELLLRPDDERVPAFSVLTRAAEGHGLFGAPHLIGTKLAWARRIADAALVLDGHELVPVAPPPVEIARHRTAIARNRLSAPMQSLVRHDFVGPGTTVLDYGCGQGDDVRALVDGGVDAFGWDPHFRPGGRRAPADAVNLGFVLNVIEKPAERIETLRLAWSHCRRVLAVAVMVAGHRPTAGLRPYGGRLRDLARDLPEVLHPDRAQGHGPGTRSGWTGSSWDWASSWRSGTRRTSGRSSTGVRSGASSGPSRSVRLPGSVRPTLGSRSRSG